MTLRCEHLGVRYGVDHAVSDLTWEVSAGVHAILGPNGAGKSTLMSVLSTARHADEGSWSFDGVPGEDRDAMRRITGYLPQDIRFYQRLSVRENLEYFAWMRLVPSSRTEACVRRALELCRLTDRADDRVRTLSGGMRRRLGIAQAILAHPALVILDEPTAGLDIAQRVALGRTVRDLAADGACVIMSTHLPDDVEDGCASVLVMSEGRAVFKGDVSSMIGANGSLAAAYLQLVAA